MLSFKYRLFVLFLIAGNILFAMDAGDRKEISVNGVGFAVRYIPPGTFMMGSPASEAGRTLQETQYKVEISKGFWMMETTVTQELYEAIVGKENNHSRFTNNKQNPANTLSWYDAIDFCKKLSDITGKDWTLPTEAQWEYACRAGTTSAYYFGNDISSLDEFAWYEGNSQNTLNPVAQKKANQWGLYDMHGNVLEWCLCSFNEYPSEFTVDPVYVEGGTYRVIRGGGFGNTPSRLRSASRVKFGPGGWDVDLGFRAIMIIE